MSVVDEASNAIFIHNHLGRHAPELEQVDLLTIQPEHAGFGVGQANEGQVLFAPVRCKGAGIFWTQDDHLSLPFCEFLVVLAQLRHVPAAEWSKKATVEHEQHVRFAAKIGQANRLTLEIAQGEVWGWDV